MCKVETETCSKQAERRRRGPRLWRARDRVRGRTAVWAPDEAAEQLRKTPKLLVGCCIEQPLEHGSGFLLQPVPRKPERNERVVVRPHRTVVIRHRIEPRF